MADPSRWELGELVVEDDDVVLDTPRSLLSAMPDDSTLSVTPQPQVSKDVVNLVTDAFRAQREAEIQKRRQVLYELTHPNPADYTYNNKLVPPPPLSFGKVTEEAVRLGEELMLTPNFLLVNQAGVRAEPHRRKISAVDGRTMIEVDFKRKERLPPAPNRGRKREDNIYRDHNYFFEINEMYQEIVMVGRASAGKSSLLNALLGQSVAKTSSTPHTTRKINFYQSVTPAQLNTFHEREHHNMVKLPGGGRQLTFVDMPGYGIEGMSDAWRDAAIELTDAYFGVRRSVNTVLFCIDCDKGLTKTDLKYFSWLENVQGVFYIVLTKCDAVSHARVCSVMRQVYTLITKNRKKYRKVFPFIIPTSAKDGNNMDVLRGLIIETSGMISGDRLRNLLARKKSAAMQDALVLEANRVEAAHRLQREHAKQFYLQAGSTTQGSETLSAVSEDRVATDGRTFPAEGTARGSPPSPQPQRRGVTRPHTSPCETNGIEWETRTGPEGAASDLFVEKAATEELRRRRQRFLAWRQQNPLERLPNPYGDLRYRLNTGLENPLPDRLLLDSGECRERAEDARPVLESIDGGDELPPQVPRNISAPEGSRVLGMGGGSNEVAVSNHKTGRVSHYLETLSAYEQQPAPPLPRRSKGRAKEEKWRKHFRPNFMAEDDAGRLAAYRGGQRYGPSLVTPDTPAASRQILWKAQQLKELLQQECRDAPWAALSSLGKRVAVQKQESLMAGMKQREIAAYARNAGRITESFEKFEGEVTAAKYANEVRQARTLRSQQQMHLNATAKINYRSMPPGLWKRYGEMDSYWPTDRVLGRAEDESHSRRDHLPP